MIYFAAGHFTFSHRTVYTPYPLTPKGWRGNLTAGTPKKTISFCCVLFVPFLVMWVER